MQRSFTIWSFLTALAVCAAGCDTGGGGTVKQDETERAKYESVMKKGSTPTGMPGMPGMGGAGGSPPADYPGADEAGQMAPKGAGPGTQPSGQELEKLYKKKGG